MPENSVKIILEAADQIKKFIRISIRDDGVFSIKGISTIINGELTKLYSNKGETQGDILRLQEIPLIAKYNEIAEKLAQIVSEILKLTADSGEFFPISSVFTPSTLGGFLISIPKPYSMLQLQCQNQEKEDFFQKEIGIFNLHRNDIKWIS